MYSRPNRGRTHVTSDVPEASGGPQEASTEYFCGEAKQDIELSKKIYVGNLSFSSTEDELKDLFGEYGSVESAKIIEDRETGRSRGFGFVEMADASAADKAIQALDGNAFGGRNLKVNEAQDRQGGGGGGSGGGGGGGGRRY